MDLVGELHAKIEEVSKLTGLKIRRPIPKEVRVVNEVPGGGCTGYDGDTLLVARGVTRWFPQVLKKEAVILHTVPSVDDVPQVHDVAWYYSGSPKKLWLRCRIPPEGPFHDYDPYDLLSLIQGRELDRAVGNLFRIMNLAAERGSLDFETYVALLNRIAGMMVRITESDAKIMEIISRNPLVTDKEIRDMGITGATLSRSLNKLRMLGMLFGPENVDHWKLGLMTLLITFPNTRECRRAFWRFPYTYSAYIPVSSKAHVRAYLSYPYQGLEALRDALEGRIPMYLVRDAAFGLSLDARRSPYDVVGELSRPRSRERRDLSIHVERPEASLDRNDLKVLNLVFKYGRVTQKLLKREKIPDPKKRLSRLRKEGYIVRIYFHGIPKGMEKLLLMVKAPHDEMMSFHSFLRSLGSALTHYLEGDDFKGMLSLLVTRPEVRGDLIWTLRSVYGDKLILAEDFLDISPGWRLSIDLWDEESGAFTWEEPIIRLERDLEACLKKL